jgi:probable HAF family extracellular repeat protein
MKVRPLMFAAITLLASVTTSVRLAAQEQNQRPPNYVVTDVGTLGGTFGEAIAVNYEGAMAGDATLLGDTLKHAFFWSKGIMSDLGTIGGPNSRASSLNERGEVTGSSETPTPDQLGEDFCQFGTNLVCLPFIWRHGAMVPLPTLGGNGQAVAVNSRGLVAGAAENDTLDSTCPSGFEFRQVEPVLWEKGEIHTLPTINGDPDGSVHALNDNGQAVGNTFNCTGSSFHAVRWQHGKAIDLGALDGLLLSPLAINNRGQIVGAAFSEGDSNFVLVAFLWQNGVATNLGTLPPDVFSLALGINDKGQVVGDSCDADFSCRAFLWQDGTMTELNTLVRSPNAPFLENGNGINSRGQIAGKTTVQGTPIADAFLATPSHGGAVGAVGENALPAVTTRTSPTPRVLLPEDIRRMLRQRMGFRVAIPSVGAPRN